MPHIYRTVPRFTQMRYHILWIRWQAIFNQWWTCRTYLSRLKALRVQLCWNMLIDMLFSALQFHLHIKQNNNDLFLIIDHLMQNRKRKTHLYLNFYCQYWPEAFTDSLIRRGKPPPVVRSRSGESASGGQGGHLCNRTGKRKNSRSGNMTGYAIINYVIEG